MVDMNRVKVTWGTGAGGAGLSVFYTLNPVDATAELGTFFNAVKAVFPNAVSWQIPSSGDIIKAEDGTLNGAWTGGTAANITATGGSGSYAAGTGAFIRWQTGDIVGKNRVKGRTFMCPLIAGVYDNDGTITAPNLTIFQNAANTLVAAGKLRIWARPGAGAEVGSTHPILAALVPDKVTSLRTRRS